MSKFRNGYDPKFLGAGYEIPMPTLSLELQDKLLRKNELRDEYIADYIHYSLLMNAETKQAFFSAANLDQDDYKKVEGRRWFIDPRIGGVNQIANNAYKNNEWDRGHLTRRAAVTWGSSYEAKRASNDSCSYANASLQHENFNQDEWRIPEQIVAHFDKDKNNRLSVFTGPIFTSYDRWYMQNGMKQPVRIPSGFWKVVAYIDRNNDDLQCQAYIMYQDANFQADKRGRYSIDIRNYQVTISEIERVTGLEFDQALFETNPLLFFSSSERSDGRTNIGPEAYETPYDLTDSQLDRGIVFNRSYLNQNSEEFEPRKRSLTTSEFDRYIESGNIAKARLEFPS